MLRILRGLLGEASGHNARRRRRLARRAFARELDDAERIMRGLEPKRKRSKNVGNPETPPKEQPALLPCPFCGGSGVLHYQLCTLSDWEVVCEGCGASSSQGGIRYTPEEATNDWNTRMVGGHLVLFQAEKPGVVGPTATWVVLHGGYMYGPCERWQDVEKIVREEWEHDRNLVG